jgi:hypothetical protein
LSNPQIPTRPIRLWAKTLEFLDGDPTNIEVQTLHSKHSGNVLLDDERKEGVVCVLHLIRLIEQDEFMMEAANDLNADINSYALYECL